MSEEIDDEFISAQWDAHMKASEKWLEAEYEAYLKSDAWKHGSPDPYDAFRAGFIAGANGDAF